MSERPPSDRPLPTAPLWIAGVLSMLWLAMAAAYWLVLRPEAAGLGALVGGVLPLLLIWIAALAARTISGLRTEAAELRIALEQLRASRPAATGKPEAPANFVSRRDAAPPSAVPAPVQPEAQPSLQFGPAEPEPSQVSISEFITAINFPDGTDDKESFRALRAALADPRMAKMIRAAQDILTLLAQDGIYMDDLTPDRAKPDAWRSFAQGARGREIAALGGVRDRSSLALTVGRMRSDMIFRDAAHHFLRQFDRTFSEFEKAATDAEIAAFSETRTAKAFMLLGRVTGTFD